MVEFGRGDISAALLCHVVDTVGVGTWRLRRSYGDMEVGLGIWSEKQSKMQLECASSGGPS